MRNGKLRGFTRHLREWLRLQLIRNEEARHDVLLLWSAILLLAWGVVMVYSSSISSAGIDRFTGWRANYYLLRHTLFLGLGLVLGLVCFQVPPRLWQRYAPWLFLGGLATLVLAFLSGIGYEVNGAKRWISLGFIRVQPSEFMKFFVVLYAADYTVRKAAYMHSLMKGFFPMFLIMLTTGVLLLWEPDFGALVIVTLIAMGILFLGGFDARLFVSLAALLVVGLVIFALSAPYRLARIIGFIDPFQDPYGRGYQLSHALIAFGRGEWFGVGLGRSVQKLSYLPEAHTDFLLAILAEEFGFLGVATLLSLFCLLIWRAYRVGQQAARYEHNFDALASYGIALWIGAQAIINIGVNVGLLPTKGLTLPLLSFGGSGLISNMIALAVLLRIDADNRAYGRQALFRPTQGVLRTAPARLGRPAVR